MEYRSSRRCPEKISVIGLGCANLLGSRNEKKEVIKTAIDNGVNFFDLALATWEDYEIFAEAISGRREKVITQIHFGAVYEEGKYGWTRDLGKIREQFALQVKLFGYTDMGYIHCVDDNEDLQEVLQGGIWDLMQEMKAKGAVRHLGFSSHNSAIAESLVSTGLVDMFMFSVNPAYDYRAGEYSIGEPSYRASLYQECEKMGVGISVMKVFAGGQLLDAKTSLYDFALTQAQCFQYALDRPGVLTVLPGIRNMSDLQTVLKFTSATAKEKDYGFIGEFVPKSAYGKCVYCNHCQPCPMGIDIGFVNKCYDLALAGDELIFSHYSSLPATASSCAKCGHCESRCPFRVKQMERMEKIAERFGK
ncbi:MAG: aldo/keto reductase [Clostridiales bacterium]|nr:aldo/keto reductase [Clostridiales bacterium]